MSKWKVQNNGMMGDTPFVVYRKLNDNEVLHSGNMEFGSNYMASKEAAQAIADKLNEAEETIVISKNSDNIKIKDHEGTWYVVDSRFDYQSNETLYELEHEEYGDMAQHLIVDSKGNIIMDEVWNGFDDFIERFER